MRDALATIVGNWVELERCVLEAARERYGDKASKKFGQALNQLLQEHVVSAATVEALRGLQAMRNLGAEFVAIVRRDQLPPKLHSFAHSLYALGLPA